MSSTNNVLNIASLQNNMENIVFDYIDTVQNWQFASQRLNELLQQAVQYYQLKLADNEGALPKVNTYWTLYMDIVANLIYFVAYSKSNIEDIEDAAVKQKILKEYNVAVNLLPNLKTEESEILLDEIDRCSELIGGKKIERTERTVNDCLERFKIYVSE